AMDGSGAPRARDQRPSPAELILRCRHTLLPVIVIGGSDADREAIARAFHRHSPMRGGPFVRLDAVLEDAEIRALAEHWIVSGVDVVSAQLLVAAHRGTLFVDRITRLSETAERMLYAALRNEVADPLAAGIEPQIGRLIVGSACEPWSFAAPRSIREKLYDYLDKIRVHAGPSHARAHRSPRKRVDGGMNVHHPVHR
ncbi:MAG: sigma 54-interacting transcriptional regulator, partial [Candidatus Eisenbacteria bacterium]|nr:sigma 54-interacting transcriptional regulator [Candidatus Eisenbacteria bacterium]